ncbi:protocatechuate 3,4-dioxygenase subunit alpha [Falsiroseomonas sp. HC035]|uniref:protocatechuate 3,4-dioxygenase subunit alpha n=1 Tax=Falsiroseomonas sp. HC035 TaxID=3390999 RepID=UPI003D3120C2
MTAATASQTAGPYWHMIDFPEWADLLRPDGPNAGVQGERITLTGRITDGDGAACADALVEIWQAGPDGRYSPGFHGFGRCASDADGQFRFTTLKPGPVPGPGNATQAPHIALTIFARGLMKHVTTRVYFADEPRNAEDPILALVPAPRRGTLLARPEAPGTWRLDIRLQGADETVFLDI